MARHEPLDIGEAARRIRVTPATLRLYERRGLLPKATRTAAGYRQYSHEDMRRARLVRRARHAGLSMRQIAEDIAKAKDESTLRAMLRAHAAHLECERRRIERLQRHLCRWLRCCRK